MELIDKSALVVEIEKEYEYWKEKEHNFHSIESEIRMSECQKFLLLLNSLEVKEVNLEKEIQNLWNLNQKYDDSLFIPMNYGGFCGIAKHFFELGLKAQKRNEL